MNDEQTIHQLIGDAAFRRLIDAFYEGIAGDPLLRPMYPQDLTASKEHMFLFLTQYFGGPARYNALRGHPRLRMRHAPFVIDQAARDAWMRHMRAAVDRAGIPEPAASLMRDYFERAATFLINQNETKGQIELLG
ncbi:MAG TPA: globin [Roseiflexaceae bacterium]|nr:globin [Roseiflexaceae bacterium]